MKSMTLQNVRRLVALALLAATPFQSIKTGASQHKEAPSQPSTPAQGSMSAETAILTDTEGLDFNPKLRELNRSVKEKWMVNMPPSVMLGNQDVNTVEFRVLRDGTIPKEFIKMVFRSGKNDLDIASLQAIRQASPISHLPEKFSQPFILLRFMFYYNSHAPKS